MKIETKEVKNDVAQLTTNEIDTVAGGAVICYGPPRYQPRPIPNYGDMRVYMGRSIGWVFR